MLRFHVSSKALLQKLYVGENKSVGKTWDESHLLETFWRKKEIQKFTRALRSQVFGPQNLDDFFFLSSLGFCFQRCKGVFEECLGAGLQACRLTCELEQLEILSSIHSKLHFCEKLVEGLHGQSLSQKRPSLTHPLKKKTREKNKRKNTVSVSVPRIYLGTYYQIPKIPRSKRMVAWLC